ncbi:MAG: SLBB domain-containing protein, partial [Clostridia bacterium]|nr:SLBB domain-containing protein [Clostridia bacterium]
EDMERAIAAMQKYFGIKRIIIGVESNKKKAIASMKALAEKNPAIKVCVLPSVYPQGGEKVLVYHTTKKVIVPGKLPIDVGCVVCNCTTVAAIGNYLKKGMPLVKKCVTVDGACVENPQNVIVPLGTLVCDVLEACGGLKSEPYKVLYGGPMMGITIPDWNAPILKNTNAILALSEKEAKLPKTTACIRCGSCTNTCPFGLAPVSIAAAYKKQDANRLEALFVNNCM